MSAAGEVSSFIAKNPSKRGFWITFEGGEGAGKSTLMQKLALSLAEQGHSILVTREPGGSLLGEHIRGWLLQNKSQMPICQKAELLLFLAARTQHLEERILPAIEEGKVVLCDRFNDSTIAYQGAGRGLGVDFTETLCDLVCDGAVPDLTFYLDVDPAIGLARTKRATKENAASGEVDRIESEALAFHERVRQAYHALERENPLRIQRLNGNLSQEEVFQQALKLLSASSLQKLI